VNKIGQSQISNTKFMICFSTVLKLFIN